MQQESEAANKNAGGLQQKMPVKKGVKAQARDKKKMMAIGLQNKVRPLGGVFIKWIFSMISKILFYSSLQQINAEKTRKMNKEIMKK